MNKTLLQEYIDLLNKANEDILYIKETLRMERELYANLRELSKSRHVEINELKDKINELQIGHNRYEKLRRLSPMQFHELYEKNIKTGEHFDKLVDKL